MLFHARSLALPATPLLFVALMVPGCTKHNTSDPTDGTPDFTLSAAELGKEYEKDPKAAQRKFGRKIIQAEGVVNGYGWSASLKKAYLSLEIDNSQLRLTCFTADPEPWGKAAGGQKVKIKGIWPSDASEPMLMDCVLVETGPYSGVAATTEQLLKDAALGKEHFNQVYRSGNVVVVGEIIGKKRTARNGCDVYLKGNDDTQIRCSFTSDEATLIEHLKVGEEVKILGLYMPVLHTDLKEIHLLSCAPVARGQ